MSFFGSVFEWFDGWNEKRFNLLYYIFLKKMKKMNYLIFDS